MFLLRLHFVADFRRKFLISLFHMNRQISICTLPRLLSLIVQFVHGCCFYTLLTSSFMNRTKDGVIDILMLTRQDLDHCLKFAFVLGSILFAHLTRAGSILNSLDSSPA